MAPSKNNVTAALNNLWLIAHKLTPGGAVSHTRLRTA